MGSSQEIFLLNEHEAYVLITPLLCSYCLKTIAIHHPKPPYSPSFVVREGNGVSIGEPRRVVAGPPSPLIPPEYRNHSRGSQCVHLAEKSKKLKPLN